MSRMLVKRAASGALMASPYKKYRMAYSMGAYAYKNRRHIYRAARTIGRGYRKYRKRKQFARPPNPSVGSATSKSRFTTNNATLVTYQDRTQNLNQNLAFIPHTTSNQRNNRQRNIVNLRGFKICFEVNNISSSPLYFNVAIVVPKQTANVQTGDFFRQRTEDRGQDFATGNLTGLEYHCLPINTDKYYVIVHKRFLLNRPAAGASLNREFGSSFKTVDWYTKYNRQVRYADNADTVPDGGQPVLLHWAADWGSAEGVTPSDKYQVLHKITTYFREPK